MMSQSRFIYLPWALYLRVPYNNSNETPRITFGNKVDRTTSDWVVVHFLYDNHLNQLSVPFSSINIQMKLPGNNPDLITEDVSMPLLCRSMCCLDSLKKDIACLENRPFEINLAKAILCLKAIYLFLLIIGNELELGIKKFHPHSQDNVRKLYNSIIIKFALISKSNCLIHSTKYPTKSNMYRQMHGFGGYMMEIQGVISSHFFDIDDSHIQILFGTNDPKMIIKRIQGIAQIERVKFGLESWVELSDYPITNIPIDQTDNDDDKDNAADLHIIPYNVFTKDHICDKDMSDNLKEKYICCVCFTLALNPPNLSCSHLICLKCAVEWWKQKSNLADCPQCKKQVNDSVRNHLIRQYDSSPQSMLENNNNINCFAMSTIQDIKLKCPSSVLSPQCSSSSTVLLKQEETPCNAEFTLGFQFHNLIAHKNVCNNAIVRCKSEGCNVHTAKYNMPAHQRVCQFMKEKCKHCEQDIPKCSMSEHLLKGEERGVLCNFMVECKYACRSSEKDGQQQLKKRRKMDCVPISIINTMKQDEHYSVCPNRPIYCKMCKKHYKHCELGAHMDDEKAKKIHIAYLVEKNDNPNNKTK
jgi:hypothetical protein